MNIIFLSYINRSGSTYLANLLSSSDDILACPEGEMLVYYFLEDPGKRFEFNEQIKNKLLKAFTKDLKLKYWDNWEYLLQNLEQAGNNLEAFNTILINYKNQIKPNAGFILFKAERIIYLVRKIQKVATNHTIRFISIIRDPRAVFASQKRTCFPGTLKIMSNNPVKTAMRWKLLVKMSCSLKSEDYLILKFEDLITNYYTTLQYLSSYLGIELSDVEPEHGDLYQRLTGAHVQIHKNLKEKPDKAKIDGWQAELSPNEIYTIERMTFKYLKFFDYKILMQIHNRIIIYFLILCHLIYFHLSRFFERAIFHTYKILAINKCQITNSFSE